MQVQWKIIWLTATHFHVRLELHHKFWHVCGSSISWIVLCTSGKIALPVLYAGTFWSLVDPLILHWQETHQVVCVCVSVCVCLCVCVFNVHSFANCQYHAVGNYITLNPDQFGRIIKTMKGNQSIWQMRCIIFCKTTVRYTDLHQPLTIVHAGKPGPGGGIAHWGWLECLAWPAAHFRAHIDAWVSLKQQSDF